MINCDKPKRFKPRKQRVIMLDEKKVKVAFQRIREENLLLSEWIIYLKERVDALSTPPSSSLSHEVQKVSENSVKIHERNGILHQHISETPGEKPIDDLTELQKRIFFLIGSLQREGGTPLVSVSQLTIEVYGAENRGRMQTTIANYLKRLEELCLVQRTKKGRNSFVSLSDYGREALATHHVEKIIVQ